MVTSHAIAVLKTPPRPQGPAGTQAEAAGPKQRLLTIVRLSEMMIAES
jgi:hypothetical protein